MKRSSSAAGGTGAPFSRRPCWMQRDDRDARVDQHAVEVEEDRGRRHTAAAHARAQPPPPAPPGRAAVEARRRRDGRPHLGDPVVERQLAGDQAVQRVGDGRLDVGRLQRGRQQRDHVERLDGLADPLGDLARGDPLGQQLARAPVAALRRQRGGDQVAGPGQPDHRLRARALALGEAPDLEEDVPGRRARRVQALRLGRARGQRGRVLGHARTARRRPGRPTARTPRPRA